VGLDGPKGHLGREQKEEGRELKRAGPWVKSAKWALGREPREARPWA
jgi:hypothetical protein